MKKAKNTMPEPIHIPGLQDLQMQIFDYSDIKTLLNEYLKRCRQHDKRLSKRYFNEVVFAKSTPGYLQSILNKKYKFSDSTVERLIQLLQTKNEKSEYLYVLTKLWDLEEGVRLPSATLATLEEELSTKEQEILRPFCGQLFPIPEELWKAVTKQFGKDWNKKLEEKLNPHLEVEGQQTFLYKCLKERCDKLRDTDIQVIHLNSWGHLVIYRLIKMLLAHSIPEPERLLDPKFIREQLNPYLALTPAEVQKCLEDLQTEGVLLRTEKGIELRTNWRITDDFLWVKKFHRDFLEQASRSLDEDSQKREFQTIFIPTTPEKIQEAKQQIEESKARLRKAILQEDGSILVSMGWQLFPVANFEDTEKEGS